MRPSIPRAAALAAIGLVASAAPANFTFSIGTPNTTLIPGKTVVQLYALNNGNTGGNDSGTLIKAFAPVLTANGGGLYVSADNGGTPGDPDDDTVDLPNAAGPSPTLASAGNGFSYVRLGTAAQTFQVAVTPNSADPYVAANAAHGIASFTVTETTTANVNAGSTVNGGLGFRVAVLVLDNATTSFTLSGQVGGDTGTAQTITPQTFGNSYTHSDPFLTVTPASVTVDVSPPGLEGFSGVIVTTAGVTVLTNSAIPAPIADNVTVTITGTSASITGQGFTYADRGTYVITFTGSSSGGTATGMFTLNVVPEPVLPGAFLACAASLARRARPRRPLCGRTACARERVAVPGRSDRATVGVDGG